MSAHATRGGPVVGVGPRNARRLGAYRALDGRLARTWRFPASTLTTFLEVNNLLGNGNHCCVEYEFEAPDEEEGTTEPNLDLNRLHYLGAIPSIGFTWQFQGRPRQARRWPVQRVPARESGPLPADV